MASLATFETVRAVSLTLLYTVAASASGFSWSCCTLGKRGIVRHCFVSSFYYLGQLSGQRRHLCSQVFNRSTFRCYPECLPASWSDSITTNPDRTWRPKGPGRDDYPVGVPPACRGAKLQPSQEGREAEIPILGLEVGNPSTLHWPAMSHGMCRGEVLQPGQEKGGQQSPFWGSRVAIPLPGTGPRRRTPSKTSNPVQPSSSSPPQPSDSLPPGNISSRHHRQNTHLSRESKQAPPCFPQRA
ncbi:hypothetical protein AMECASPLE_029370 [Ameca splendens]|uniref:Secreted protein n=1 Tax=Ameca splendens TaxID=208324 RepID=A0ABV1A262_9TELE